jgi:hypothetical protein
MRRQNEADFRTATLAGAAGIPAQDPQMSAGCQLSPLPRHGSLAANINIAGAAHDRCLACQSAVKMKKSRVDWKSIRRVPAMFIFSIRTVVLAVAMSASSLSSAATLSEQSELLCSPEGLMRLIPQFNVNGQFAIPNPNTDLQRFLSAQQGLSNAIDMILARENISQNPSDIGSLPSRPLTFASNWLSSEVGIQTDGKKLSSPEARGKFGGYRVQSFLYWTYSCAFISGKHICNQAIKPNLSGTCLPDAHEPPLREQACFSRWQYCWLLAYPDICSW